MLRVTMACAAALIAFCAGAHAVESTHSAELDEMIARQAKRHGVPEKLVRRVVMRESRYNPRARNHSFWGLMQISYPTARSMGFKGSPSELLDPVVNLTYAVPYLANAFIIAGKQEDAAVRLYAHGYYMTAKNRNMLDQLRTADSVPLAPDEGFLTATARPVSNLITAVVSGPPSRQPLVETASLSDGAAALPASDGGKGDGSDVAMVRGKAGLTPPPKWTRDGGMTLIGRGEQRVELIAAYGGASADAKPARRTAHAKSRKITQFASLDAPPPDAQAYAGGAASVSDAGPQAAITQATTVPATGSAVQEPAVETTAKPSRAKGASRAVKMAARKAAAETVADGASTADAAPVDEPPKKSTAKKARAAAAKPSRTVAVAKTEQEAPAPTEK